MQTQKSRGTIPARNCNKEIRNTITAFRFFPILCYGHNSAWRRDLDKVGIWLVIRRDNTQLRDSP